MNKSASTPERRRAWLKGRNAERYAALTLRLKGYRILAQQYRTPVGEIDIVARRGRTIVFVEVKARAIEREAREAIIKKQQKRIMRAAEFFIQHHVSYADFELRFDAILIMPWRWPYHLQNAWQH